MNYDPNMNANMNANMYSNQNVYPNPNPTYNPSPFNVQPVVQQPIAPIVVSTCHKCHGTGYKIGKKGRKVCKKCHGMVTTSAMNNRQVVVMNNPSHYNGNIHPYHRRTWCGCLKVSKKGYNKCKCAKGCNIL
jgi:hypothetical protein